MIKETSSKVFSLCMLGRTYKNIKVVVILEKRNNEETRIHKTFEDIR